MYMYFVTVPLILRRLHIETRDIVFVWQIIYRILEFRTFQIPIFIRDIFTYYESEKCLKYAISSASLPPPFIVLTKKFSLMWIRLSFFADPDLGILLYAVPDPALTNFTLKYLGLNIEHPDGFI